ncbi:MAG: glycosyltransferase family 4 protein [Chloroflexota bacterium]
MRILWLSAWCPLPADNGIKLRTSHLLRALAQKHTVDLLTFAPDVPEATNRQQLADLCEAVELIPETPFANHVAGRILGWFTPRPRSMVANHSTAMAEAVQRRAEQPYDLVIASDLHMAPYALMLPNVPRMIEEIKLALLRDQFIQQKHLPSRLRTGLTWLKTSRYIAALLSHFAGVTVPSQRELALVNALAPRYTHLAVIPNGVDVQGYSGYFTTPDNHKLVYPGAISYHANFDAVSYFSHAILPHLRQKHPDVELVVTGKATPEQIAALPSTEGIHFTGYVDDIRPVVAGAWAEVVPIREGDGTRLKVLEALALGTPVVTTTKGIEGLELQPEQEVLVADTAEDFVSQTMRLLTSTTLRQQLADRGRIAARRYDWQHSTQHFVHMVEGIVNDAYGIELRARLTPRLPRQLL